MIRDTTCNAKNVIYVLYCIKCMKQSVSSTTSWKPRLSNYKNHVKKKKCPCRIVRHFIENCNDYGFNKLRYANVDGLNNVHGLKAEETDDLILKKKKFRIRTLITQHHGFNDKHDFNRKRWCEREKLNH